jgi:hypothetical protein
MSRNIIFVLMYRRHELLDLVDLKERGREVVDRINLSQDREQ